MNTYFFVAPNKSGIFKGHYLSAAGFIILPINKA